MDTLRQICILRSITFIEEQIDIISAVLCDSNELVRHAVKRLLL